MQDKSAVTCSLAKRLETVRLAKHLTWDGLAGLLEMSPSMIYQVRRGDRNLGDVAMHRLEQAEIAEGLLSPNDAAFARLLRNSELSSPERPATDSHDAYIAMRLEALADIVDTYDSGQMNGLLKRLDALTKSENKFGKVFDQLAHVVSHLRLRKTQKEDVAAPKAPGKRQSK